MEDEVKSEEESNKLENSKESQDNEKKPTEVKENIEKSEKSNEKVESEMNSEEKKLDNSEENKEKEEPQVISKNAEEKSSIIPSGDKMGKIKSLIRGKGKEGSWKPFIIVMVLSMVVFFFWENQNFSFIKEGVHAVFDPSIGSLLKWNLTFGMIVIGAIISLFTTLAQKYCTDQDTIKELKKEQKLLQKKANEFKHHPEKMMEIQKEMMPLGMKISKLSMRAVMFTGIPFVLFFRWFRDFFGTLGECGFFCNNYWVFPGWILFYFIAVIIFGSILRKLLKVV